MSESFLTHLKAELIAWAMGMVWLIVSVGVSYFLRMKQRDFQDTLVIILMVSFFSFVAGVELRGFLKE